MSLTVIHKDSTNGTALVKGKGKSFPVKLQKWLTHLVCVGDTAIVKKSPVSGELIMVDYVRFIDDVIA